MNRNKIFYGAAATASLCLIADFFVHGQENGFQLLLLSAVFNLIYISGWMYSIRQLLVARGNGNPLFAKNIFELQLSMFFIANACNILVMMEANDGSYFSHMCEFFWVTSNVFMTVTAVIAMNAKNTGGKKHLIILASVWIPMSLTATKLLRSSMVYSIVIVLYPTLACLLVGYLASSSHTTPAQNPCADRKKYRSQKKYMLAIN